MAKEPEDDRRRDETERTRLEVVHLLRQILQESKISAHGATPVMTDPMRSTEQQYQKIESQIALKCNRITAETSSH